MATTTTLSDGTKLRTSSNRRYVLFAVSDDSKAVVLKRSDSISTINESYHRARGYLRKVIVDQAINGYRGSGIVVRDSADAR